MRKRILKLTSLTVVDTFLTKFTKSVFTILVINLLATDDVGLIGLATSYLAITGYLNISPENMLFRTKIEHETPDTINRMMTSFINFILVKGALFLLISLVMAIGLGSDSPWLGITFFVFTLNILFEGFQELARTYFFVHFQQGLVTKINLFNNLVSILLIAALWHFRSLPWYLGLLLTSEVVGSSVWAIVLFRSNFSYVAGHAWWPEIRENLKNFSFWNHLNSVTTNFVYNIDPFVLQFYATVAQIGLYTIALKISNFFFLIPMLIQRSITVHLTYKEENVFSTLKKYVLIMIGISLAQLIPYMLFGKWLIVTIFTQSEVETVYSLTLIILIGISLLNIARPMISYVVSKSDIRASFIQVFLPLLVISITVYFCGGYIGGMTGVAYGNIINYGIFILLLGTFILRRQGSPLAVSRADQK